MCLSNISAQFNLLFITQSLHAQINIFDRIMNVIDIEYQIRITCHKFRLSPGTLVENGKQPFNPDRLDEIDSDNFYINASKYFNFKLNINHHEKSNYPG